MSKHDDDILKQAKKWADSVKIALETGNYNEEEPDKTTEDWVRQADYKQDDFKFDEFFNFVHQNRFYSVDLSGGYPGYPFSQFQQNINALYLYYQYLKRFINYYTREASEHYERQHEIGEAAAELSGQLFYDFYEEMDITDEIAGIQYENIVMSLYTVFERFLKEFIKDNEGSNSPVLDLPKGDNTVNDYMNYLHREKKIFVPASVYYEYDKLRLIRNYFVHSSDRIGYKLQRALENDKNGIYEDGMIVINDQYIDSAFKTVGAIVKCIEKFTVQGFKRNGSEKN